MNVLVWQTYGNVDVLVADTIPQLQLIIAQVGIVATGWGIDKELVALIEMIAGMEPAVARRNISNTVYRLCHGHEAFETFTFTTVQGA